jgi:hypothetical protein
VGTPTLQTDGRGLSRRIPGLNLRISLFRRAGVNWRLT